MTMLKLWIAVHSLAWLTLLVLPAPAEARNRNRVPGEATRASIERQLGKPVRTDGPAFAEYRWVDGSGKAFVRYREGGDVVEQIEVMIPIGMSRAETLAGLGLSGEPNLRRTNDLGKLEEHYAMDCVVLTYRGADAESGVHRASYLTREAFDAGVARAGGTVAPPPVQAAQGHSLHFDRLAIGPLSSGAFESEGVRIIQGMGTPGVYAPVQNMVLPAGRSKVLLIGGERTTSLIFVFESPVSRFGLTRIGTAGGASVPAWILQAFDGEGRVVGSTGEEHGDPSAPEKFSVDGAGIARVVLSTDNRDGDGTWATWNSLPVAEFEFQR